MDLSSLPAVETLARSLRGSGAPARSAASAAREAIDSVRLDLLAGTPIGDPAAEAHARARRAVTARAPHRAVLNATGILLHTNLGRAVLAPAAATAAAEALSAYSDLEIDLATGLRGGRHRAVDHLLRDLTGAQAGLAVNNNAGAVVLAVAALAGGGEVLVSRGELVEIGGGFRVPDVVSQSGARVVEVGTTNRTRAADYARAVGPATRLLLHVHPSNFRQVGFTEAPSVADLAAVARRAQLPLVVDTGSGLLDAQAPWLAGPPPAWLAAEPAARQVLAEGASVVTFSGDKLLGGPQAGIAVGARAAVAQLAAHPLARALRIDKAGLAALHATLELYAAGTAAAEIPFWRMATCSGKELRARLAKLDVPGLHIVEDEAMPGGGSVPGRGIPGPVGRVPGPAPDEVAHRLRTRQPGPAVLARVEGGALVVDLRAVPADDDAELAVALRRALEG